MQKKIDLKKYSGIAAICGGVLFVLSYLYEVTHDYTTTVSLFFIRLVIIALVFVAAIGWINTRFKNKPDLRIPTIIISIVALVLFVFCLFVSFLLFPKTSTSHNMSHYEEFLADDNHMPAIDELNNCSGYEYTHFIFSQFIFESDTQNLIVSYDSNGYDSAKQALDETFTFEDGTKIDKHHYTLPASFTYDGFVFRLVCTDEDDFEYPHHFMLIGTSDKAKEIAYIYFSSIDLDYIDNFPEFVEQECGWKYIK